MEEILHQTVDPSSYYGKVQEFCHQQEPLFEAALVFTIQPKISINRCNYAGGRTNIGANR